MHRRSGDERKFKDYEEGRQRRNETQMRCGLRRNMERQITGDKDNQRNTWKTMENAMIMLKTSWNLNRR